MATYEEIASMKIKNMEDELFGVNKWSSESITLEKILKAKKELDDFKSKKYEWYEIKNLKTNIGGMKIIEHQDPPKLKLSENVSVSDSFRREYDAWLLARFGYKESLLKDNECFVMYDTIVMKPEMANLINSII